MAKGDKKVKFTQDFGIHKKDAEVTFSRDLVNRLKLRGVVKDVENKTGKKSKTQKSK